MNRASTGSVRAVLVAGLMGLAASGCADDRTGSLTLALAPADYFTLQVFADDGTSLYDTGCLQRQTQTFRLTFLPVVENASILFHYYADAACDEASHVGVGFRGDVAITADSDAYYYIPVLADGGVTALPAELNVSRFYAVEVDQCVSDLECGELVAAIVEEEPEKQFPASISRSGCYKILDEAVSEPVYKYWCVPVCDADADCVGLHEAATCDLSTNWCTIPDPFPLNMSGPRAFGHAAAMPSGDVLLIGGLSSQSGDRLSASGPALQRYNASEGLFEAVSWDGDEAANVAMAGMVMTDEGSTAVLVGGATSVVADENGFSEVRGASGHIVAIHLADGMTLDDVVVDLVDRVTLHENAMAAVVDPGVLATPQGIVVAGGFRADADGDLAASDVVTLCVMEDASYVCTQVATLAAPRVGSELACVDDDCAQIMVLGGNESGAPLELVDWGQSSGDPDVVTLESDVLPASVLAPSLCAGRLVGGVDGDMNGLSPVGLVVDGDAQSVAATVLENVSDLRTGSHPAVIGPVDGECWIFGGTQGGTASKNVWLSTDAAVAPALPGVSLEGARYGSAIAAIGGRHLSGGVMVAGGLTLIPEEDAAEGENRVRLVHGAEIFRP